MNNNKFVYYNSLITIQNTTLTSTEHPIVHDGFWIDSAWHIKCTREDFPTPREERKKSINNQTSSILT